MAQVDVQEAKTQLSKLLARVTAGEEIVIARAGKAVARLVPVEQKQTTRRVMGLDADREFWIADDFDAPLSLTEEGRRRAKRTSSRASRAPRGRKRK